MAVIEAKTGTVAPPSDPQPTVTLVRQIHSGPAPSAAKASLVVLVALVYGVAMFIFGQVVFAWSYGLSWP